MTTEHRVVFDLSDIRALRVECAKCHLAISYQLDQTFRVPHECPGCHEALTDRHDPNSEGRLVEQLADLVKALARRKDARVRFRLEFEDR